MRPMTLEQVARATGGRLHVGAATAPTVIDSVATDTRTLPTGSGVLFVALRGERFDGHDHAAAAADAGVSALLVSRDVDAAVPRWVLIGAAGALLIATGVTWERRLQEARHMVGYVRSLR